MRTAWIVVASVVLAMAWPLVSPARGHADEARISMSLQDALLKDTLESLKRDGSLGDYTLAPSLDERRVSVALSDVTAADAVKSILDQAGAEAVDDGTTLVIRPKVFAPPPAPAIVEPVIAPKPPSVTPAPATSTSAQAATAPLATTNKPTSASTTKANGGNDTGNSAQSGNRSRSRGGFNGSASGTLGHGAKGHSRGGFHR